MDRASASGAASAGGPLSGTTHAENCKGAQRGRVFMAAFAASVQPMAILWLNGRFAHANAAFLGVTGWPSSELVGRTPAELWLWADPFEATRLTIALRRSRRLLGEKCTLRRRGGQRQSGLLAAEHTKLDGKPCVLISFSAAEEGSDLALLRQRTQEYLSPLADSPLMGWVRALELRDAETCAHSTRVVELTVTMASLAGLADEQLVHVRRGALLHDIGKIAVPDRILHKPGPLTPEEWATMRLHPEHGYELLLPIEFLRPALEIPLRHHERWDGRGYPDGLRGDEIPLAARLFAVVDVWDALRSPRLYKQPWPDERVFAYLRKAAGTQFDPEAVALFEAATNLQPADTGRG